MTGSRGDSPRPPLSERMAAAARDMEEQTDPAATYVMATELAVTNVDGCEAASLSVVRARRTVETRGATSDEAREADDLQGALDEGPCLDAIWEHSTVHCPSLGHDDRWPTWGPTVVEQTGLQSVLSFRLFNHKDTLGALNMYSSRRNGFDDEDRVDGEAIAAHIAIAIAASQKEANLDTAVSSRTVIGQATGVVMERFGVTAEVAFKLLVRISSTEEIKVRDLAIEVTRTGNVRGT